MIDLLLEIRSEEIPARLQKEGERALVEAIEKSFRGEYAAPDAFWKNVETHSTPRRLAWMLKDIDPSPGPLALGKRGPKVGAPVKALEGFALAAGTTVEALEVDGEGKAARYFAGWEAVSGTLAEFLVKAFSRNSSSCSAADKMGKVDAVGRRRISLDPPD